MSAQTTAPAGTQWFALHTLSGQENKVKTYIEKFKKAEELDDYIFEILLPTEVVSEVKGGKKEAFRFLNALSIFKISNNLGDAKSLITHPATTTHQRLTPEARAQLGITDSMVRLSVGLEDPADIVEDLDQALAA